MNTDIYYVDGILDGEFTLKEFADLLIKFKGYAFYTHAKYGLDPDNERWAKALIDSFKSYHPEYVNQIQHKYIWSIEKHIFVIGHLDSALILNKSAITV